MRIGDKGGNQLTIVRFKQHVFHSTNKTYLNCIIHVTENVIDLILETARQHLVGLVEDEDFDGPEK